MGSAADPGRDPGRVGGAAAALPVRLAQHLPLPHPLRLLHWVRIVDVAGLNPILLPQSAEREECFVSEVLVSLLHRCALPTILCSVCSIVKPNKTSTKHLALRYILCYMHVFCCLSS